MRGKKQSPSGFLPAAICRTLREEITTGALSSGTQLNQARLAKRFETSAIPVREALRQLAAEGLVVYEINRGATVSNPTLPQILDMMEVRIALECHALALAIPNMVETDVDTAQGLLDTYSKERDPGGWGEFNWRFHSCLYAPCGSPKLLQLIQENYGHVGRFLRLHVSLATGKDVPQQEHQEILDACRKANVVTAVDLMKDHIKHTMRSLVAASRNQPALALPQSDA